jgi:signal peptidase II
MKIKYLLLATVSGLIICVDQITKMYIHTQFHLGENVPVVPGLFDLHYLRNPGAAFGFLAQSHPEFRDIFFLTMPPVALIMIFLILRTVHERDRFQILALSSIFGGAIGNYIDRLRFGYVIDFLDFYIGSNHWPAFNIADSAIVCGVGFLILHMIRHREPAS